MLIMEYASGGELFDYIVKHTYIKELQACKFFQQILSGVEYLSELNIVHRDLKPENMLIDFDKGIKLVDFGLSNTFKHNETLNTACGSPCYAAPEMISGKPYNGTKVDIWSLGVVLFALLSGFLPFEDPDTGELYKKILSADYQLPDYVSESATDLIAKILTTDPEKRISIPEIRSHPWFNLVPDTLSEKPGTMIGMECPPFDQQILDKMKAEHNIDQQYSMKSLEANSHNSAIATYFLLLKQHIKLGNHSIADSRLRTFDKTVF
jgi:5'-AMP-activated protein kinase, catalytic alpha subunit